MGVYDHEGFEDIGRVPEQPLPHREQPHSLLTMRVTWRGALLVIFAIVAFRLWVLESAIVDGNSMSSTLLNDEWVLVLKPLAPHRFSVVVFTDPQEGVPVIKRVVGMPGDTVSREVLNPEDWRLGGSPLLVNNTAYAEPYARSRGGAMIGALGPITVPADSYYVLGDNRDDSADSRTYGPIKKSSVKGVAVAIVYPFARLSMIPSDAEPAAGPAAVPGQ